MTVARFNGICPWCDRIIARGVSRIVRLGGEWAVNAPFFVGDDDGPEPRRRVALHDQGRRGWVHDRCHARLWDAVALELVDRGISPRTASEDDWKAAGAPVIERLRDQAEQKLLGEKLPDERAGAEVDRLLSDVLGGRDG